MSLAAGVTITNPAFEGLITNIAVSNAVIQAGTIHPANIVTTGITASGTNSSQVVYFPGGVYNYHIGDNFVLPGNNQVCVLAVEGASNSLVVYPPAAYTFTNQTVAYYPLGIHLTDINSTDAGGIGNDGSYILKSQGEAAGWEGLVSNDGNPLDSMFWNLNAPDATGYAFLSFTHANGQFGGGIVKFYIGPVISGPGMWDTLDVLPNPAWGGAVSVRSLTNNENTVLPVLVPLLIVNQPTNPSTPQPSGGYFWSSNSVLYWVTTSHTNYVTGP